MAEAIARHHASEIIEASSAGLAPLGYIVEPTLATLAANGYSSERLSSKRLFHEDLEDADLVVNLSGRPIDCVPADHARVEEWPVEDPYGTDLATYQRIFEEIEGRILTLAARLRSQTIQAKSKHE